KIIDSEGVEGGGSTQGLGLLPVDTYLSREKKRELCKGKFGHFGGLFSCLSGLDYSGYEIHMGRSEIKDDTACKFTDGATGCCLGNVYGTYVHGVFDEDGVADTIVQALYKAKGLKYSRDKIDRRTFRQNQYDKLADMIRNHMDMDYVYGLMGLGG
ncbi:MAG: cobyric acid synthase CobQ, partial [Lachnospiraceae bacterium]|nr:cobyric acid synthase CobQ [Lachnospiraceae bacterium]